MKKKSIKAEEFDAIFDKGDEITEYLIVEEAEQPGLLPRCVSIDFPAWMVKELDREAHQLLDDLKSNISIVS